MSQVNNTDVDFWILVGIIAVPILFGLIVRMCLFIYDFSQELKYLNDEIGRTTGAERRYWIRERQRLLLSLIPFVKY